MRQIENFTFQYGSIQIQRSYWFNEIQAYFTFQYGSIQINNAEIKDTKSYAFTFQYGSIQIKAEDISFYTYSDFTFQYGSIQIYKFKSCHSDSRLYIPIWFYSNLWRIVEAIRSSSFTFQYGSIQIKNALGYPSATSSLHSNMVLFKSILDNF